MNDVTNEIVMNNTMQLNNVLNVAKTQQEQSFNNQLSYLDMNNRLVTEIGQNINDGNINLGKISEQNDLVGLHSQVNNLLLSIDHEEKTKGVLSSERMNYFNTMQNKIIEGYKGKINNNTLLDAGVLPLRTRLHQAKTNASVYEVKDYLDNILSPYQQVNSIEQLTNSLKNLNDPDIQTLGKSIYGTAGFEYAKQRAAMSMFQSALINTNTRTPTETASVIKMVEPYLPPAIVEKYKKELGAVYDVQQYLHDELGLSKSDSGDVNELEAKALVATKQMIRQTNGDIQFEDLFGNLNKADTPKALRLLALLNRSLEADGDIDKWEKFRDRNLPYFSAMVFTDYGQFDPSNFTNIGGSPLLNSTSNLSKLQQLDNSLTTDQDSTARKTIEGFANAITNGFLIGGMYKNGKRGAIISTGMYVLSEIFDFSMTEANMGDIQKAHIKNFQDFRMANGDLTLAALVRKYDAGKLDITKRPDGKYGAGTQDSALSVEFDLYKKRGVLSDVARENVIEVVNEEASKFAKLNNKEFGKSNIATDTNLELNTILAAAYSSKGYSIGSVGGQTVVTVGTKQYYINKREDAQLLIQNAFKLLNVKRNLKEGKKLSE